MNDDVVVVTPTNGRVSTPTTTQTPQATHPFYQPAPPLAQSRYNRQLLIPQISLRGQERISRARVLIVGLGGLGSPAALYLAGAGVHTLGLLDHDVVEQSNLHRQIVHRESSLAASDGGSAELAMTKVCSAYRGCRELNSEVNYVPHEIRLNGTNALDVIRNYDVVLDCTDNPATRYLISDCCVVLEKTLVSGAAQKLEGQMMVLHWPVYGGGGNGSHDSDHAKTVSGRGPCYRCVFPVPPSPDMVKSCSEIGILGPVVGAVGTLMASETLRLIVRDGEEERKPTMLLYSAWPVDPRSMFRVIGLRSRRKDCVACGEHVMLAEKGLARVTESSIRGGVMDYVSWCGLSEDVDLLDEDQRISAEQLMNQIGKDHQRRPMLVDVREEFEVEIGPKIEGSINIPFSRILRGEDLIQESDRWSHQLENTVKQVRDQPIVFICQRGNDSQIAAQKLIDRLPNQRNGNKGTNPASAQHPWIGDLKGGLQALDKLLRPG